MSEKTQVAFPSEAFLKKGMDGAKTYTCSVQTRGLGQARAGRCTYTGSI